MSIDDLQKMNSHITAKQKTRPMFTEHAIGTKFDTKSRWKEKSTEPTWSHKNILPNIKKTWVKTKKAGKKFRGIQDSLRKEFPGLTDDEWWKKL